MFGKCFADYMENIQSEPYQLDYKHKILPLNWLLDSSFYFERLVIMLLYTMQSVRRSCISIKLYQTDVNIEIGLLGKKS